jgi:hypothetical protein
MDDRQLANAAAVYFGGRHRAEHMLTCSDCHLDEHGKPIQCRRHPDRRERRAPWASR